VNNSAMEWWVISLWSISDCLETGWLVMKMSCVSIDQVLVGLILVKILLSGVAKK
jgi:hypothetical protein